MLRDVMARAAEIENEFGMDVEEAVSRFQDNGASLREPRSALWLSVAFLFSRKLRGIYHI